MFAKAFGVLVVVAVTASCSSNSSSTTPSAITPATFVMTWPTLAFPTTGVGRMATSPVAITLWNNGTAAVPITTISDSNATEFPFTTTCQLGGSLAPSSTCSVTAQFTPVALGARTATLTIAANGTSQNFALTGTGANVNPQLALTPAGDVAPNVVTLSAVSLTPNGSAELHTIYTAVGSTPNTIPTTAWAVDALGNLTATFTADGSGVYEQWIVDSTSGIATNHVLHQVP